MLELFKPDIYQKSILDINYKSLKTKGIKCIVFDLDNTLTDPHKEIIKKEFKEVINNLKKDYIVVIMSNSLNHRVKKIANKLEINYYSFCLKPSQRKYKRLKKDYNLEGKEILCIGDQIMTDVLGAKKAKASIALIKPLYEKEHFLTKFNRIAENIVFKKLEKKYNIKKGEYFE